MKKISAFFMSVVILLTVSAGAFARESASLPMNTFPVSDTVSEQILKEQPAIRAYEEINTRLGIVDPSNPSFPNYPDNFGGAYYEDEKLHIFLTENTPQTQQEYTSLVSNPSVLVFETANYSYNELYEGTLLIAAEADSSFSSVCVDVPNNEISIGLPFQQASPQRQSAVAEISAVNASSLPISYTYEKQASSSATEIRGGQEISWPKAGSTRYGTVAICGTWQGNDAILTAGHCVIENTTYQLGGKTLGTGVFRQYDMDEFYDYGVIRYTGGSSFTLSNKVLNNANYTTITSTLASSSGLVGTTVCKYGKTTNFSTGEIKKVNAIVDYGEVLLYGMTKVIDPDFSGTTIGAKGDSGGPVYSGHKLYGIYSGDASVVTNGVVTTPSDHYWYSPISGASGFTVRTS